MAELEVIERLGRNHRDVGVGDTGRTEVIHRLLGDVRIVVETVDGLHGARPPTRPAAHAAEARRLQLGLGQAAGSMRDWQAGLHLPDRDDRHELREQRVEQDHRREGRRHDDDLDRPRADSVPHEYGNCLCVSDGTMIRKRSSHMPITTPNDATTQPAIARVFVVRRGSPSGITKLHVTIVQ